jgi:very-short-patch-repair endonuclease
MNDITDYVDVAQLEELCQQYKALTHEFVGYLKLADLPEPRFEYRFHPQRKWRFDVAWPEHKLAVELNGGVYTQGRHTRGKGYEGDLEKLNAAVLLGWRVLQYSTGMMRNDPAGMLEQIQEALEG